MKLFHKARLRSGATLGFLTGIIFIVFAVGAALFFLQKLVSGEHELLRASDAGILSVARQAPVLGAVDLNDPTLPDNNLGTLSYPYADFSFLSDKSNNSTPVYEIDLMTYNRCAAQAMLIALNAQAEGTENAIGQAQIALQTVQEIGKRLKSNLLANSTLDIPFNQIANQNSMQMLEQSPSVILNQDIQAGYVNTGYPANVFLDPILAAKLDTADNLAVPTSQFYSKSATKPEPGAITALYGTDTNGNSLAPSSTPVFMAGYQKTTFFANQFGGRYKADLCFVPNLPTITPHCIDLERFTNQTASISNSLGAFDFQKTPPNCFQANCKSQDTKTKHYLNAVSCAIVGVIDSSLTGAGPLGTMPTYNYSYYPYNTTTSGGVQFNYFPVSIPAGYIRIVNAPLPDTATVNPHMAHPSGDYNANILADPYLTYTQKSSLIAGPTVAYDGSKDFFNNTDQAVSESNPLGQNAVWVATGNFPDANHIPFGQNNNGRLALKYWAENAPQSGDPNSTLKTLHMGSVPGQMADIADANKITGYYPVPISDTFFDGSLPWMETMLPIVCANLGYTDGAVASTDPNSINTPKTSFTAVEWEKAKLIQEFASNHVSYPPALTVPSGIASGLRYYQPWDSDGNLVHYSWPQPVAVQNQNPPLLFEQPGTIYQYLSNIIKRNSAHPTSAPLSANDFSSPLFVQFINPIITAVKQINPKYGLNDILYAFGYNNPNAPTLDLGAVYYLHSDSTGQHLVLDQNVTSPLLSDKRTPAYNPATVLPTGWPFVVMPTNNSAPFPSHNPPVTENPSGSQHGRPLPPTPLLAGQGSNPIAGYFCEYTIGGSTPFVFSGPHTDLIGDDKDKTIVDTSADPTKSFSNLDSITAPWGDAHVHRCPWKQLCPNEQTAPSAYYVQAIDQIVFTPSCGFNNFLGEIRLANWLDGAYPSIPN